MMNSVPVAVSIDGLNVVRGKRPVIESLTTTIRGGEITGLLGPSGCGKTTLMRSIVGVQIVTGGTVTVLGVPAGSAELRHRVGYVTQAPSIYSDLTIGENLDFFAAVLGVSRADCDRVSEIVGLGDRTDQLVGRLSGGQRSRVSLAVALLGRPDLLVLDEPTVGLDPVLRKQLWDTFDEIVAGGASILVSSHVMDEAQRCDRLLLMRDGALIADGTNAALLAATHTDDIESAFLAIVEKEAVA